MYERNLFVTLTYDDKCLPPGYDIRSGLNYSHFQNFMKRLRDRFSYRGFNKVDPIRFYMCGEYGDDFSRPHFHALLFNFDFPDRYYWCMRNGERSFRSSMLDGLPQGTSRNGKYVISDTAFWPYGNAEFGEVTFKSAAYVARYVMKKVTGDVAEDYYTWVDPVTGEYFQRRAEFNNMSRRPGIGKGWIEKFTSDVYPNDIMVVNGVETKPPRYYDNYYATIDPQEFEKIKASRQDLSQSVLDNNTPERLVVREVVAEARLSQCKRSLT